MADGWSALAHSTSQLPALGMGMVGMRERSEDRDIALGIAKERLGMQEETAKQMQLTHQAQLANAEAKLPKDQQVFNPSMVSMAEGATLKQWGPTVAKSLTTHLLDPLREIAAKDEKSTFGDAHAVAKSIWGTAREGLSSDLSKALASGKLSPEESKKVAALLDTVQYDPDGKYVIDQGVFKNTAESIRQREENSKSAVMEARNANRLDVVDAKNAQRQAELEARIAAAGAKGGAAGKYQFVGTDAEGKPLVLDVHTGKIAPASESKISAKPSSAPPKEPSLPLKRLDEMVKAAGSTPDPSAIEIIGRLADEHGMEYTQVQTPGKLYGTNTEWKLVKKGGNGQSGTYKSADEVKAAFQAKKISEAEATKILQSQFGYK